ncbi:unnamed protein product [Gemmataceae bacterium]|nr:unnamed protein product [Gemmataceae bacterium]VTT99513.1 unnamed protein product [Gemmataceae bacterium]
MAKSSRGRVPAAAPFTFAPPLVDQRPVRAARDATLDLRPWAAYTLGYQVGTISFTLHLAQTVPQLGPDGFAAVPGSASVIRLACDLLSTVAPAGTVTLIREAANDLEEFNNNAEHAFHRSGRFVWDVAAGNYLAGRLPVLMRGTLPGDSPLLPWLGLGHSIGEFISSDPAPSYHPPVPFRPVVDAVRNLPKGERDALRELREMAALIDRPEAEGEAGLRRAYVARLAADWPFDELDPWPNSPFFTVEIQNLHRRIDEHLLVRKVAPPPREVDHVPRWDHETGKLLFEGKVIRQVVPRARTIRPVLDLFQRLQWPSSVETDYSDDRKDDVIESLNRNLKVIEFFPSGTKTGIGWKRKRTR